MNRNATRSAGIRIALIGVALLATSAGWPATVSAQSNPVTEPIPDGPSQIQTPDGDGSTATNDGPTPVDVSYFESPRAMYATTSARVRSGPGTSHASVGTIPYAGEVSVLGEAANSSWLYIQMGDGTRGFTAASLLSSVRPTAASGGTTGGPTGTTGGSTPGCVAGQVLIQMGDGTSICAYLQ